MTLFWRSFLLIAALLVVSVLASFQITRVYEREPRARELAKQTVSVVNLTRAALVNADPVLRRELLIELNEREGIRIYPVTNEEKLAPLRPEGTLERVAARVRALGVKDVRTSTWYGEAASAIVDAAVFNHADLIVMTTHGRSGLGRLVMGSVAESVLRGTTMPILVLRDGGAPVQAPAGTAASCSK